MATVGIGPRVTWLTANIPCYQRADVVEWLRRAVGSTIRNSPSGQWFAVLKSGRAHVSGRTFSHEAGRTSMAGKGASCAGGRDRSPVLVGRRCGPSPPIWLEERQHAVSAKTYKSDAALPRLGADLPCSDAGPVPSPMASVPGTHRAGARRTGRVVCEAIPRLALGVLRMGGARADDRRQPGHADAGSDGARPADRDVPVQRGRTRAALRAGLQRRTADSPTWCSSTPGPVCAGPIAGDPGTRLHRGSDADVVVDGPSPRALGQTTKSGRSRRFRWPIACCRSSAPSRGPRLDDLLCVTESGHQLHATAFKRTLAGQRSPMAGGSTISGTRPPACGWPAASIRPPFKRGWVTPRRDDEPLPAPPGNRLRPAPDWTA